MKFHCDCCGLCCRHIDRSHLLKDFDRGDGVCKFLSDENLCRIYAHRPDFCNVEAGYYKYFADRYSEEEYLRLNYEACTRLKAEFHCTIGSSPSCLR